VDVLAGVAQRREPPSDQAGPIFLQLGLTYGRCQAYEAAIAQFQQAAPRLTGDQQLLAYMQLGAAHIQLGQHAAAIQVFEQAVEAYPASVDPRYALAQARAQAGDHDGARREFRTLIAQYPLSAEALRNVTRELNALTPRDSVPSGQ